MPLVVSLRPTAGCLDLMAMHCANEIRPQPLIHSLRFELRCGALFALHSSRQAQLDAGARAFTRAKRSSPHDVIFLHSPVSLPPAVEVRGNGNRDSPFSCRGSFGRWFGDPPGVTADETPWKRLLGGPALATPPPPPLPLSLPGGPPDIDRWICGLYYGMYGSHGLELCSVALYEDAGRLPHLLATQIPLGFAADAPLLVATKVTGDPNVPVGKITWIASLRQDIPLPPYDGAPAFGFRPAGSYNIDIASRRSRARAHLPARFQINRNPGVWEPEWQEASLLVYNAEGAGDDGGGREDSQFGLTAFSLLWPDVQQPFVLITDYGVAPRELLGLADDALLEL